MEQRRMDYHLHTFHSSDGRQSVEDLCESMVLQGVEEICLTEHIEPGHPTEGVDVQPLWDVYKMEIFWMNQMCPNLKVRAGVEIGDNPPFRQETLKLLSELDLDFHLLSLHLVNGVDPYDKLRYFTGRSRNAAYREYAEAKAESVMNFGDFDSVAHIGYVAKFSAYTGNERPLRYEDAPDAFDALLKYVIDHDKCIEVNTSGYRAMGELIPDPTILRRYVELGGEQFTLGSDSHCVQDNYQGIERAKEFLRSIGGKYQASYCRREKTLYRL